MSDLPTGWATVPLGEIAATQLGKMLSKKAKAGVRPLPYLRNKNVQWGRIDTDDVAEMDFSEEEFERFALRSGDLLVCEGGEVGRAAIWRGQIEKIGFQKALHRVRPFAGVAPEFLVHQLRWFAQTGAFETLVTGSTIKHLPQEDFRTLRMRIPPAPEQMRIVAAIHEQFSRLDAADDQLTYAAARLVRLRDAILGAALEGPWEMRPLSDLLLSLRNGAFVSRPATSPPGTPIFRISAVRPMALDVDDVRYAPAEKPLSSYLVSEGDLLFTRYSGNAEYVGACARVKALPRPTAYPDKLIRATVDRGLADSAFVELACATGSTRQAIRDRRKTTAGQVGIAGGQLKSVPVPLPPLDEQRRIVAEAEQRLSVIDAMRAAVESAQRGSAALRRSILERAFRGELVPQDPSDEPASVLLERIRVERAAQPKPRRIRRAGAIRAS